MQYVSEDQHCAMVLCILHKLCSSSSPWALNLQLALLCNLLQIPAQVRGKLEKGFYCSNHASYGIVKAIFCQMKLL